MAGVTHQVWYRYSPSMPIPVGARWQKKIKMVGELVRLEIPGRSEADLGGTRCVCAACRVMFEHPSQRDAWRDERKDPIP